MRWSSAAGTMDPYPVRVREFPIDPYYTPVKFLIYSIKVIPIVDGDAKVFPSWAERKLVQLELVFDPFTLETTVCVHDRQNIEPREPSGIVKPDGVIIGSSFFVASMASGTQRHVKLGRAAGTQNKILAFYERQSPTSSLTSGIAGRIITALTDVRKEIHPSLELYFEGNEDARAFLHAWSLAFGREVDPVQLKKATEIIDIHRQYGKMNFTPPPLDSITRRHIGTPVSLQTPVNASSLVLSHLLYEKSLLITQSNFSLHEPAFTDVRCHHHGHAFEIFIPHSQIQRCLIHKYPGLSWHIEVTSTAITRFPPDLLVLKVEDSATRNLRQPLLYAEERQRHIESLVQAGKIDGWLEGEQESYWWIKFTYSHFSTAKAESRVRTVNITFPPSHPGCAIYTQPMLHASHFASRHPTVFIDQKARPIDEVFLGHRHGRLLPNGVVKGTNILPPTWLFAEQTNVFNHVLSHDFTVVDGAPGTGKSRVATEIILAFLLGGKQVLVMTTSDATLDFLATSVLNSMPQGDVRAAEMVARLRPPTRQAPKLPTGYRQSMLESVALAVSFRRSQAYGGKPPYAVAPGPDVRDRLQRTPVIFMTTYMAERLDPFYDIGARKFDLIVLDDANTCSESLGLQLSQHAFADPVRWLVIGCSKGITPTINVDEFNEMEICGSWHTRLLRHPEFRLNPLRLTKQSRLRNSLYEPLNAMLYNNTITTTPSAPQDEGDHALCMGFVNTARTCRRKRRPSSYDEEILEMLAYHTEVACVFALASKLHRLAPYSSIIVMCHTEAQKVHMYAELERAHDLAAAAIVIQTIDEFANKEASYAIVHLPLWKNSYAYTHDAGRFATAATRAKRGLFVVGNLRELARREGAAWPTNPWRRWVVLMDRSAHGAVFEGVAEVRLGVKAEELAELKRARAEMGRWLGMRYSGDELVRLRSYW